MSQVAIVTGAAQGLGLSIVSGLSQAGYTVVATDVNDANLEQAVGKLDKGSEKIIPLKLDVLSKDDFINALDTIITRFSRCDVLVNNAAMTPTTPVMEISAQEFDQVMSINLRGTLFGCQVFGANFVEQGYGRIINMASLAGQMGGTVSGAHYAASKGGILTLTKLFARLFAANGVTVNAIAPGPTDVPSVRDKVPAEKLNQMINNMIPVKAMSEPELIADMVVMLASKNANSVTGACWDANGGIFMR